MDQTNLYLQKAQTYKNELIQNRRTFHQYAETGFELPQTTAKVTELLHAYGLDPKPCGKAGITCTVGQGSPVVLLRGDMDALPMTEESGLPFAAQNGHCHSCGHDTHTAMLLLAAKLLKEQECALQGTVKFMFQPAEELLAGAKDMVAAGVLENPKVDAAIGLHIAVGSGNSSLGNVYYSRGAALFSGDAIRITVSGKDAHGSSPYLGVDAINIAAHIIINLQEILAREIPSTDHSVVLVGMINGGSSCNTMSGSCVLEASVRTTTAEKRAHLKQRVKEISEDTARTFRGQADVEFVYGISPLYNNPELCDEVGGYVGNLLGDEMVHIVPTGAGTEDFTAVAELVPAIMLNLGAGSLEEGHPYGMHNPHMVVDEDALPIGAALYAHCATEYLKNHHKD